MTPDCTHYYYSFEVCQRHRPGHRQQTFGAKISGGHQDREGEEEATREGESKERDDDESPGKKWRRRKFDVGVSRRAARGGVVRLRLVLRRL